MKTDSYLDNVYRASLEIDNSIDPYSSFELIFEKITAVGLRNCMIRTTDNDYGAIGNNLEVIDDPLRVGILDRVARTGEPLIVILKEQERAINGNASYLICVPVRYGHDTIAVLAAEHEKVDEDVLEKDLQLLSVLAALLVIPVQKIRSGSAPGEQFSDGKDKNLSMTRQVENFERRLVVDALKRSKGNQTKAAALLGVSLRIINYKISKFKLDYRRFRKEK